MDYTAISTTTGNQKGESMRYGARPSAEWKHKAETEAPPQRKKWSRDDNRLTEAWPMAWVGRPADSCEDTQVYEWDEFLNQLGRDHRQLGRARAMGSVAITYIDGVTVQRMLQDKFDKYNLSPSKAVTIQKTFADNLRGFMQHREFEAVHQSPQTIALQRQKLQRFNSDLDSENNQILNRPSLTQAEEEKLQSTQFGTARLAVNGLSLYGKNKLGLDLSQNEILYQERSAVLGYLRSEGYNISRVSRDWKPHAVVFDMFDHISSRSQVITYEKYGAEVLPEEVVFFRPNIDSRYIEV